MERWIKKDGKYQHLVSNSDGLYVNGKCVCEKTWYIYGLFI